MEYIILLSVIGLAIVSYFLYSGIVKALNVITVKLYNLKKQIQEVRRFVAEEHKATRKETQELKTRATQDRKDLNDIQKRIKKGK